MNPRDVPIDAPADAQPPPPPRNAVERHADLTGHNGCYQLTLDGWSCAVCEALAAGDEFFKVPASGRPPSGCFERWASDGYVWVGEAIHASR